MGQTKSVKKTIRLTEDENKMIQELAAEFGMSESQVMRYAMCCHMADYFSTVRFLDDDVARDIRKGIARVGDEMQKIRNEIHYIGVNYNQLARKSNSDTKYQDEEKKGSGFAEIPFKSGDMKWFAERFAACEREVSEILCLIHQ